MLAAAVRAILEPLSMAPNDVDEAVATLQEEANTLGSVSDVHDAVGFLLPTNSAKHSEALFQALKARREPRQPASAAGGPHSSRAPALQPPESVEPPRQLRRRVRRSEDTRACGLRGAWWTAGWWSRHQPPGYPYPAPLAIARRRGRPMTSAVLTEGTGAGLLLRRRTAPPRPERPTTGAAPGNTGRARAPGDPPPPAAEAAEAAGVGSGRGSLRGSTSSVVIPDECNLPDWSRTYCGYQARFALPFVLPLGGGRALQLAQAPQVNATCACRKLPPREYACTLRVCPTLRVSRPAPHYVPQACPTLRASTARPTLRVFR